MKKRKIQSGQDLNERLDNLDNKVDQKFDKIDEGFDRLESKIDGIINVMKGMASKDDLKKATAKIVTKDHFDRAVDILVTKVEFDDFKEEISENMYTKDDQNNLLKILDPMALGFKNAERGRILTGKQICDMDDEIADHGKRIRVLEKKI